MVSKDFIRLMKKYADDFLKGFKSVLKGFNKGYPTRVDIDGREIFTFFETLRSSPDFSDRKYGRPRSTPPKKK
jgi:hypothetical protein